MPESTANLSPNQSYCHRNGAARSRSGCLYLGMACTESAQSKTLRRMKNVRLLLAFALLLVSGLALCQVSVLNIGQQQMQWQQGNDRIRSSDGVECSRSTAPRDKWMEFGTVAGGVGGQGSDYSYQPIYATDNGATVAPQNNYNRMGGGIWGKLVVNLDKQPEQIDCGKLYNLELERLQEENRQLKMGAPNARPK